MDVYLVPGSEHFLLDTLYLRKYLARSLALLSFMLLNLSKMPCQCFFNLYRFLPTKRIPNLLFKSLIKTMKCYFQSEVFKSGKKDVVVYLRTVLICVRILDIERVDRFKFLN